MLFMVKMKVNVLPDTDMEEFNTLKAKEKDYSQRLQREGVWKHIWRISGKYENYSVFDVESNEHLHDVLMNLPLLKYIDLEIEPMGKHPSAIE